MRKTIVLAALLALPALAPANIMYSGDLSEDSSASGSLRTPSGWVNNDATDVNFFSFSGSGDEPVSVDTTADQPSSLSLGISLYQGVVTKDLDPFPLFFNNDDFGGVDFLTRSLTSDLDAVTLPATDDYTLAIGGAVPDIESIDAEGPFTFDVTLAADDAEQVPTPAALPLLLGGLLGMFGMRRR